MSNKSIFVLFDGILPKPFECVALLKFTCNCQHSSFISTMKNNTYYLELYWCLIPNSPYMIKFLWLWRIIIVKSQKTECCQENEWQTVFNWEAEIRTCQLYPFHVAALFVFSIIHIPLRQIAFLLRMSQAFQCFNAGDAIITLF